MVQRKLSVQLLRRSHVRHVRLFLVGKVTEPICFIIQFYCRTPFTYALDPVNTFVSRFVGLCATSITHVLRLRRKPKIIPSIVFRVPIYVVNAALRPRSCMDDPSDDMRSDALVLKSNAQPKPLITSAWVSSYISNFDFLRVRFLPSQNSSFWIVRKILLHQNRRKWRAFSSFGHDPIVPYTANVGSI
jgi:hypothetical protein